MRLPRLHLPSETCCLCGSGWHDLDVVFSVVQGGAPTALHAVCFLGVVEFVSASEPVVIVESRARDGFELDRIHALHAELEKAHEAFKRGGLEPNKEDYPFLSQALSEQAGRIAEHIRTQGVL